MLVRAGESLVSPIRWCLVAVATVIGLGAIIRPVIAQPVATDQLAGRIDAYLEPFIDAGHLSGHVLVARRGQRLYERSFGMANYELAVPVSPKTRFCIGSINKPMTIIIAVRLIEAGKLSFSDPVAKWIPGIPSGDKMTIEHLLNHRAGIPHRLLDEAQATSHRSPADMVELAKRAELSFEPGTDESYSSGGYSVLARVLELASGRSFEDLLRDHVFKPAGMTSSAEALQQPLMKNRAASYLWGPDGGLVNTPLRDLSYLVGAGSVYSSARDLRAMMRALIEGRLGAAARDSLMGSSGIRWNGGTHGFRAFADFDREQDSFVIFTTNLQTGAGDHLRRNIPRILAGEDPEPVPLIMVEPAEVPLKVLERYEGVYQLRPGRTMAVRIEQGSLRIEGWLLITRSETEFFSPQDYSLVRIVFDDEGGVERLDWGSGERVFPMPRVGDLPDDS